MDMRNFQDWQTVSWDKRGQRNNNESKKEQLNRNMRTGNVVSNIKQVKNEAGSSGINEKVMRDISKTKLYQFILIPFNMNTKQCFFSLFFSSTNKKLIFF